MVQAVIFDMDGVIIDSEALHKETEIEALRDAGVPITEDDLLQYTGMPLIEILHALKDERDADFDPDAVAQLKTAKYLDRMDELDPIDGAVETVRAVSSTYRTALASSSRRQLVDAVVEMLDLQDSFEATFSFDDVQHGKPDPAIFQQAAKALDADPAVTVVIEDSRNGVQAARSGGFPVIGFQSDDDIDLSDADHIADDMEDVQTYIKEIEKEN